MQSGREATYLLPRFIGGRERAYASGYCFVGMVYFCHLPVQNFCYSGSPVAQARLR